MKKNLLTKYTTLFYEAKLSILILGSIILAISLSSAAQPPFPSYTAPMPRGVPAGKSTGNFPMPQVSDKEMQGLYDYLKNLDEKELEEIEKLGQKMLTDMGFDPVTLQPVQKTAQQQAPKAYPEYPMAVPPAQPSLPKPAPLPQQIQKAPVTLSSLINHLTSLRTKAASLPMAAHAIKPWFTDINELLYFLKVMNTPELHKHLALAEWVSLLSMLATLDTALSTYEPLMMHIEKPAPWKDPYEILGIFTFASQKEIDAAYKRHQKRLDPDSIRTRLSAAGISHQEQEKAVKEAQLSYDLITDAYEQLKDEKARVLIDKERKAIESVQEATNNSIKQASSAITQALSNAIYKDQIINQLEQFLKKYEPYQLEARKKMETLEELQRKELRAYEQLKPQGKTIAVGHYDMPPVPRYDYAGAGYDRPWYPPQGGGAPYREPFFGSYPPQKQAPTAGGKQQTPYGGSMPRGKDKEISTALPPGNVYSPQTPQTQKAEQPKLSHPITLLHNQLDAFNKDFDDGLQEIKLAPQERLQDYLDYQEQKLQPIQQSLQIISFESRTKDIRKKSQNQEYWKGLEKPRKTFAENIKKLAPLYKRLEELEPKKTKLDDLTKGLTKGGSAEDDDKTTATSSEEKSKTTIIDTILDHLKKIDAQLKKE